MSLWKIIWTTCSNAAEEWPCHNHSRVAAHRLWHCRASSCRSVQDCNTELPDSLPVQSLTLSPSAYCGSFSTVIHLVQFWLSSIHSIDIQSRSPPLALFLNAFPELHPSPVPFYQGVSHSQQVCPPNRALEYRSPPEGKGVRGQERAVCLRDKHRFVVGGCRFIIFRLELTLPKFPSGVCKPPILVLNLKP
ncbi:hypothetical protein EDC04DRAFT_443989 [Pisolithus marmoratus]|nr:hypothetical protein EDC04DRAFT_443989 [Pisolithus marmoratus]